MHMLARLALGTATNPSGLKDVEARWSEPGGSTVPNRTAAAPVQAPPHHHHHHRPQLPPAATCTQAKARTGCMLGCGDWHQLQLEPGGPFAEGNVKIATRANWDGLAVVVKQPVPHHTAVDHFNLMTSIERRQLQSIWSRFPDMRPSLARHHGSCLFSKTHPPFLVSEGGLVPLRAMCALSMCQHSSWWQTSSGRRTAANMTDGRLPHSYHLQLALQLAQLGVQMQRSKLVYCDWTLDQLAVTRSGNLRIIDAKYFATADGRQLKNCSQDVDCLRYAKEAYCHYRNGPPTKCDQATGRCLASPRGAPAMIWWTAEFIFERLLHDRPNSSSVSSMIAGMKRSGSQQWNWTRVVGHLQSSLAGTTGVSRQAEARATIEAVYRSTFEHSAMRLVLSLTPENQKKAAWRAAKEKAAEEARAKKKAGAK